MKIRYSVAAVMLAAGTLANAAPITYAGQLAPNVAVSGLYPEYSNYEYAHFYSFRIASPTGSATPNVWMRYTITQPDGDTDLWRARYFMFYGIYSDTKDLPDSAYGSGLEFRNDYRGGYIELDDGDYTVLLTGYWDAWRARPADIGFTFVMGNIAEPLKPVPSPGTGTLLLAGLLGMVGATALRGRNRVRNFTGRSF